MDTAITAIIIIFCAGAVWESRLIKRKNRERYLMEIRDHLHSIETILFKAAKPIYSHHHSKHLTDLTEMRIESSLHLLNKRVCCVLKRYDIENTELNSLMRKFHVRATKIDTHKDKYLNEALKRVKCASSVSHDLMVKIEELA